MLLTQKKEISDRAHYLSTQAKNDFNFVHNEVGYNYRMINIAAALGLSQFGSLKYFKKKKIRQIYLKKIARIKNFELNMISDYAHNNCWMNLIQISGDKIQKRILKRFIKNKNSGQTSMEIKSYTKSAFQKFQSYNIKKAYELFENSICLPSSPFLTSNELKRIVGCLNE